MGDMRDVATSLRREPDVGRVIRLVRAQVLFLNSGRGPCNNQGVKRWPEAATVMYVGTGEAQAQGDALTINEKMPLGAKLAPIGRILARLIPPFTGDGTVTLSIVCHRHSMPLRSSYSRRQSLQSLVKIPALVHCWKCLWAAELDPYSRGNIFH